MKQIKPDKRRDRIPKHTKTLTTINNFLVSEDVKDVIDLVIADQSDIESILVIRRNRDGSLTWHATDNLTIANAIYLLEQVKHYLLEDEGES